LKLAGIDVTVYDLNDNRFLVTLQVRLRLHPF